jgi:hypothetical protein
MTAPAVFVAALVWFSLHVERSGIASAYCDPVSRIPAQDEAVYAREAIETATEGHWLTPTYLGRYALNKPPVLQWAAAAAVSVFGVSAWALRAPSLAAASLTVMLVFLMIGRTRSLLSAGVAALLVCSSHLYYVFARLCMTDMLLTFWTTAAIFVLWRDPPLRRRSSRGAVALCAGAAVMTKGAAGLLPLVALLIHAAIAPPDLRPPAAHVLAVLAGAAAVALPWHLYQLVVHPRWFVAEYILAQHFSVGMLAPPQYSNENHLVFYGRRLMEMDPVLTLTGAVSVLFVLLRRRARLDLLAWTAAVMIALFAFRYRSAYYPLPLIPSLAALSGWTLGELSHAKQWAALVFLLVCAAIKSSSASPVWNIPLGSGIELPAAPALDRYCESHRANELILIDPDDQFYASVLSLERVRYVFTMAPAAHARRPPIDFNWLGISVTVAQFASMETWRPIFRARLESFQLPSGQAIATVICAHSTGELVALIQAHPESDFSIPESLLRELPVEGIHKVAPAGPGRVFLLARSSATHTPGRPCRL